MTTALYATRLGHRTAVVEARGGRHAAVSHVHNQYGVSEDVSGRELSRHAIGQLEEYGADYYPDRVDAVRRMDATDERFVEGRDGPDDRFVVEGRDTTVGAERVVLATGFVDREPSVPGLERFAGRGLHYCLHCDAYTLGDERVFVLGHDDHAATVAMLMLNFTADVELLLDDRAPEWSDETERQLRAHPVERVDAEVVRAYADDESEAVDAYADDESTDETWLGGLAFAGGARREYRGGFAMYGKEYNTALAKSLGCDLDDDGAIAVDDAYETSVDGVYAVGDVTHGQNQTVVAMGDGAKAGMALHKDLRRFPRAVDELDALDASAAPAVADDLRARMRLNRERDTHSGLRDPSPNY